jgi:hypothetical protein
MMTFRLHHLPSPERENQSKIKTTHCRLGVLRDFPGDVALSKEISNRHFYD